MKTSVLLRFSSMVFFMFCLRAAAFGAPGAFAEPDGDGRIETFQSAPSESKEISAQKKEDRSSPRAQLESGSKESPGKEDSLTPEERREQRRAAARDVTLMMLGITRSSARGR